MFEYVKQIDYDQVGGWGAGSGRFWACAGCRRGLAACRLTTRAGAGSSPLPCPYTPPAPLGSQYFESMAGAARDGRVQAQYYDFSLNSAKAAQAKLRAFLALMPADQREAAATQLASSPF